MFFKKQEKRIKEQDKAIQEVNRQHTRNVNKDIRSIQKLNNILENGIALEIKKAIGGKHG